MSEGAGLPGLAVLAAGLFAFLVALAAARWRRGIEQGGRRDRASIGGIAVQATAFVVASAGVRVTLDPLGTAALVDAGIAAALEVGVIALFLWARAAMGRNWSLVARTRDDHALVTAGPFAHVRHPIYVALALQLVAVAVGLGHPLRLALALPVYALGTGMRVRIEERLLRGAFGEAYDAYAARVKRFVPGVFRAAGVRSSPRQAASRRRR